MPQQQCEQCATSYGTLQRAAECRLYACRECGCESCDKCVVEKPVDPWAHMRILCCPKCFSNSLSVLDLTERFSIYSGVAELKSKPHVVAMLFVPWSCYPKRTESLINEIIPRLADFDPAFFLLDEDDPLIRKVISEWFPSICNPDTAIGNGGVIWLCNGQPMESLHGGPYLAKLDLLKYSRMAWT